GDAGDGDDALRAVVGGRQPPAIGAAARTARDAEPLRIHLWPRFQVIERPHGVPALDARRGVAERMPPPPVPFLARVRAVVDALKLAVLQRVDDQADVTVLGQPGGMVLVG